MHACSKAKLANARQEKAKSRNAKTGDILEGYPALMHYATPPEEK
jgi:hypothetical protein